MTIHPSNSVNRIILGDVLDVLRNIEDASIDITVTSPPYNKRNKTHGWLVTNEKYSHFDDKMPEEDYQKWQVCVLNELMRITKPGGSVFYNHKLRWDDGILIHPLSWITKSDWLIRQEIVWDRGLAANMRGWRFWQVDERLYWLYKPINGYKIGEELESKHAKLSSIWRMPPARRSQDHPAAFPIGLPARAIASMPGSTPKLILDPFCGTGTTLVAAKLLGHNYIGIDISPDYVDYSTKRLEKAEKEKEQITKELAEHVIEDSFQARKKRGTVTWPFGPSPKEINRDE